MIVSRELSTVMVVFSVLEGECALVVGVEVSVLLLSSSIVSTVIVLRKG